MEKKNTVNYKKIYENIYKDQKCNFGKGQYCKYVCHIDNIDTVYKIEKICFEK